MYELTQNEFAKRCGIKRTTYVLMERGYGVARDNGISIVTAFPDVTLDWLFMGNPRGLTVQFAKDLAAQEGRGPAIDGAGQRLKMGTASRLEDRLDKILTEIEKLKPPAE
jgi:Helix-turn-helix